MGIAGQKHLEKVISEYEKDLNKIVNQLEMCNYESPEGGLLVKNVAFMALRRMAIKKNH